MNNYTKASVKTANLAKIMSMKVGDDHTFRESGAPLETYPTEMRPRRFLTGTTDAENDACKQLLPPFQIR